MCQHPQASPTLSSEPRVPIRSPSTLLGLTANVKEEANLGEFSSATFSAERIPPAPGLPKLPSTIQTVPLKSEGSSESLFHRVTPTPNSTESRLAGCSDPFLTLPPSRSFLKSPPNLPFLFSLVHLLGIVWRALSLRNKEHFLPHCPLIFLGDSWCCFGSHALQFTQPPWEKSTQPTLSPNVSKTPCKSANRNSCNRASTSSPGSPPAPPLPRRPSTCPVLLIR